MSRFRAIVASLALSLATTFPSTAAEGTLQLVGYPVIPVVSYSDHVIRDVSGGSIAWGPIRVIKVMDCNTTNLWLDMLQGTIFTTAQLVLHEGNPNAPFLTIDLEHVLLFEVSIAADAEGEGAPRETVGMTYQKVTWTAEGVSGCWQVVANASCPP